MIEAEPGETDKLCLLKVDRIKYNVRSRVR